MDSEFPILAAFALASDANFVLVIFANALIFFKAVLKVLEAFSVIASREFDFLLSVEITQEIQFLQQGCIVFDSGNSMCEFLTVSLVFTCCSFCVMITEIIMECSIFLSFVL